MIDLQKMPILTKKNHLFIWSSFYSWRACKQAKLSHLRPRKVDAPKTGHCLVWILVQRHNWAIFLRKCAKFWLKIRRTQNESRGIIGRGRYSQWRSLSGHLELIFFHKNCRGGYWQHLFPQDGATCRTSEAMTRWFAPCFWRSHYPPLSWGRLATSKLRFDTFW